MYKLSIVKVVAMGELFHCLTFARLLRYPNGKYLHGSSVSELLKVFVYYRYTARYSFLVEISIVLDVFYTGTKISTPAVNV